MNETFCKNCGHSVDQTPGKRTKEFCNVTCRSNFWQKKKRAERIGVGALPNPVPYPVVTKILPVEIPKGTDLLRGYVASTPESFDSPGLNTIEDKPKMLPEGGNPKLGFVFTDAEGRITGVISKNLYPSDYTELLRMAKAGVLDKEEFKKHVSSTKLNGNQKAMIYSKLK